MSETDLLISFWGHALLSAILTLNRAPTKAVEKTPYEIWRGKAPGLYFLKIWGCEAYAKRLISDKLAPKSDKCFFVGDPKETKGYYFYNRAENKVFVARDAFFLEKDLLSKIKSGRKIELDEVLEPLDHSIMAGIQQESDTLEAEASLQVNEAKVVVMAPRRSKREH